MPRGSSPKRERQYEHIKESYEKRGQKGRAEEIAARTVNKERAEEGEAKEAKSSRGPARKSSGSRSSGKAGSPNARGSSRSSGSEPTRAQLYERARREGISGRSSMNKGELERALKR